MPEKLFANGIWGVYVCVCWGVGGREGENTHISNTLVYYSKECIQFN